MPQKGRGRSCSDTVNGTLKVRLSALTVVQALAVTVATTVTLRNARQRYCRGRGQRRGPLLHLPRISPVRKSAVAVARQSKARRCVRSAMLAPIRGNEMLKKTHALVSSNR